MKQREIRIVAEGLFAEPGERTIRFEHVRTLVVTPMPRRRSTLVVRTAEGDVELLHLGRVYANEQAIAELRAMFSA